MSLYLLELKTLFVLERTLDRTLLGPSCGLPFAASQKTCSQVCFVVLHQSWPILCKQNELTAHSEQESSLCVCVQRDFGAEETFVSKGFCLNVVSSLVN